MTIQAVFFDMGGTIETFGFTHELRLNATRGIQSILASVGIDLGLSNQALHDTIIAGLKQYHQDSLETRVELSPEQVWREYILPDYACDRAALDSVAEELMVFIETQYYDRKMRPEVPGVIKAIQALGLKIGLISNANSRGQARKNLDQYGIRHYFDPIVLSSEYQVRKPDPAIFHYAARLMGVPTSRCVYIGDRIARDIVGAQKAGFRMAVQIEHDFDHGESDDGATPHAVIRNLWDLVEILKVELSSPTVEHKSHVRALTFDAGDVLYQRPHLEAVLKDFICSLGLDPDGVRSQDIEDLNERAFSGQIDMDEYQEAYLRLHGVELPEQIARGKQIMKEEGRKVEFFEGAAETLIALKKQGFLLGIITDTANTVQTKLGWLERGGFGHVWDSIISSKELGVCKPQPAIYLASLQHLGVTPDQAAFIGHAADELDGARAVGMKTIGFNLDENAKSDHYIDKFSDLLNLQIISIREANQ